MERMERFAKASRSASTTNAYASDWADFDRFCTRHTFNALPADPEAVALYLTDLAGRMKPSTIARRAASISVAHKRAGFDSPTADGRVREITQGIRRVLGVAQHAATPAGIGEVRRMVAHLPQSPLGARDAALLLVGLASAMRASELVGVRVEDIAERDAGLVITVRRSKTDQEGAGREVAIPYGRDPQTCPVAALRRWLARAEISDGPVFRPVTRHGGVGSAALSTRSVSTIVRRSASAAGLDPAGFSAHSLRAGFATTAAANGASERSISTQTGHKSMEVLRGYVRHASVWTDNAVTNLGL